MISADARGESTTSTQKSDRLSTGAVVEQLALKGDRLQYKLRPGTGEQIVDRRLRFGLQTSRCTSQRSLDNIEQR